MTDVYQPASSVVVWLGLDEGNSRILLMDFLNKIVAFTNEWRMRTFRRRIFRLALPNALKQGIRPTLGWIAAGTPALLLE